MRTSKIAALVGIVAGLVWVAAGVLSWNEIGLHDTSTLLWWVGLGLFGLASALVGYSSVTSSPMWLKVVVFVGAGALGASIASAVDIEMDNAAMVVAALGGALVLAGVVGLLVGGGGPGGEKSEAPQRGGRRAAR